MTEQCSPVATKLSLFGFLVVSEANCNMSSFSSTFFTLGQTLPTHRLAHSVHGGPFQPTMTQAIRLLSRGPYPSTPQSLLTIPSRWNLCVDPFSDIDPAPAYTTNGHDAFLAPSAYASNSFSWIHIFPEGMIHQSAQKTMRYFKWGVARLILEPPECPDVVPIFIEGNDQVMHESRKYPRFLPRPGKDLTVTFGDKVDTESLFGDLRRQWRLLKLKEDEEQGLLNRNELGVLGNKLMYGDEAVELREECTRRVRDAVLAVRRSRGLSDEDPKCGLVETWIKEGPKREGKMKDGTWVKDT